MFSKNIVALSTYLLRFIIDRKIINFLLEKVITTINNNPIA